MQPAPLPEHSTAPLNESKAAACYRKAAELGSAQAQYNLGVMHERGRGGLAKDEAKAVAWFRKAAAQGHAEAEHRVGIAYENGDGGLPVDQAKARAGAQQQAAVAAAGRAPTLPDSAEPSDDNAEDEAEEPEIRGRFYTKCASLLYK